LEAEVSVEVRPVTWIDRRAKSVPRDPERSDAGEGPSEKTAAPDFAALALVHAAALYRTAYHLAGSVVEAEDLTQETYLRAYRGFAGFRGGDIRAWLFSILRHVFLDECRRRKRMPVIESADDDAFIFASADPGAWTPSAESEALRCLPSEAVDRAFAALPPDWRLIVLLADVEELSYREIADIMGIPLGTVMSRLHRARKRLQEQLGNARIPGRKPHERSA
jgi:RNA polymerase sigma-70 factor, ECF subfamily